MNKVYKLHTNIIKTGNLKDPLSLRRLLLSCAVSAPQSLSYAHSIFNSIPVPDTFAWNTMIRACANAESPSEALALFATMRRGGVTPDHFTFPFVLKACSLLYSSKTGRGVQSLAVKLGYDSDIYVQNALIHFYGCCGIFDVALQVFEKMPERDLVSWSSIITCFANNGFGYEALRLFQRMQLSTDIKPDMVMMLGVIAAVSGLGALELAKWVHFYVRRNGFDLMVTIGTALMVMYAKCGFIDGVAQVFDEMPERNAYTWTALINGFAVHGRSTEALRAFYEMEKAGFWPDYITFIGVLCACSHGGLVEEGWWVFNSISSEYGIEPGLEHYGCMVDLLGRAGLLNEAYDFIEGMPISSNSIIWRTLLGACANYNNVELAERVKERISKFDPCHDGDYVILSNLYGNVGRWVDKAIVRSSMRERGIEKRPGWSLIEIDWEIHEFVAGDNLHPRSHEIREMLSLIVERLRVAGYRPDTSNVLFDVEEEEKERALNYHSEKLAVSFGLLSIDHGTTIRIVKNLRICRDCHCFMKFVSEIFDREIIVRDRNCFHHFRAGSCSCDDYW